MSDTEALAPTEISFALDEVPVVTAAQLRRAVTSALAAATTPVEPSSPADFLGLGPYGSMTGERAAHMAGAISQAFSADVPADEQTLKGLIWRGIFAFSDVVGDSRFVGFGRNDGGNFYISAALIEAVAATPMPFGGDVPVDIIFSRAGDAAGRRSEMINLVDAPRR